LPKGGKLFTLDSPHFFLIAGDAKCWSTAITVKLRDVFGLTIQDSPADARTNGRFRDLNHTRSNRFHQNCGGPLNWILLWWQVGFGAPAPQAALEDVSVVQ
jgi:hypothetical protein